MLELLLTQEFLDFFQLLRRQRRAGNQGQGRREGDVQARRQVELLTNFGGPHLDDFKGNLLPRRGRFLLVRRRLLRLRRLGVLAIFVITVFVRGRDGLERRRLEGSKAGGGPRLRAEDGGGRGDLTAIFGRRRVFAARQRAGFGGCGDHSRSCRPALLRLSLGRLRRMASRLGLFSARRRGLLPRRRMAPLCGSAGGSARSRHTRRGEVRPPCRAGGRLRGGGRGLSRRAALGCGAGGVRRARLAVRARLFGLRPVRRPRRERGRR